MERIIEKTNPVAHANLMLLHDLIWSEHKDIKQPEIYVLWMMSREGKGEESWVRYEREDGTSQTFWLNKKLTDKLVKSPMLCMDLNIRHEIKDIRPPRFESPKEWLKPAESNPYDEFTQQDFWNIDEGVNLLIDKVGKTVKTIMEVSHRLLALTTCRDHDLWMSFNVDPLDLTRFKLRFDKMPAKLPAKMSDDVEPIIIGIGETFGLERNDNAVYNQVVTQLERQERVINDTIAKLTKRYGFKGLMLEQWQREVTSILMATTHNTKKIFSYDVVHGRELLDEVANSVLDALYLARGDNLNPRDLRLDISSWFVWEYPKDRVEPVRVADKELDFYNIIVEGYTDSFVDHLAQILIDSGHSGVISPYQFRKPADLSDGYAIGSMRRAEPKVKQ